MSHVETISIEIDDLQVLENVAHILGAEWVKDKKTYQWYGAHVGDYPIPKGMKKEDLGKCDHVIRLPRCGYEIGVVKLPNGKYTLAYDFWGEGQKLLEKFGPNLGRLVQQYGVYRTIKEAQRNGKHCVQTRNNKGQIILTIT